MPFGLNSTRRLQSAFLSFLIVSLLLWHSLRLSSETSVVLEHDEVRTASEDALREWEGPRELRPQQERFELGIQLDDGDVGGWTTGGGGGRGRDGTLSRCEPIRPRDEPGHVTSYLIMVHSDETLEGARLLIEQIYDPSDLFLVHVDKKLNGTNLLETVNGMTVCDNIEFVPDNERVDVVWGDISMVDAEIKMLKRAIRSPIPWTNAILLDGTSWPVLDAVARQDWFDTFEHEVVTDGEGPPPAPICEWNEDAIENSSDCWRTAARCENRACTRMTHTPRGKPVRKGNQWTILTRDMVKYSTFGHEAQEWYDFFRDSAVPDEHFFATIKYSQPGGPRGWLRIPMYVDWSVPCKSNPVEEFTGHPCSLGMNDYEDIKASIAMFARKVPLNETELRETMLREEIKAILLPPIPL